MASAPRESTQTLVERAQSGDEAAFERLLANHSVRLELFIRLHSSPSVRAGFGSDEILGRVFVVAWRNLGEYQSRGPGSFYLWMLALTRHTILDLAKLQNAASRRPGNGGSAALPSDGVAAVGRTASSIVSQREDVDRAMRALEQLSASDRRLIVRRFLEGRSLREIAGDDGRCHTAIAKEIHSALKSLRHFYDAQVS